MASSRPFSKVIPALKDTELFGSVTDELLISIMDKASISFSGLNIDETSLATFINKGNITAKYNEAMAAFEEEYQSNEINFTDEANGLDNFIGGVSGFGASYAAYYVDPTNVTYPDWPGETTPGALLGLMVTEAHLQNVFPAKS